MVSKLCSDIFVLQQLFITTYQILSVIIFSDIKLTNQLLQNQNYKEIVFKKTTSIFNIITPYGI